MNAVVLETGGTHSRGMRWRWWSTVALVLGEKVSLLSMARGWVRWRNFFIASVASPEDTISTSRRGLLCVGDDLPIMDMRAEMPQRSQSCCYMEGLGLISSAFTADSANLARYISFLASVVPSCQRATSGPLILL